MAETVPSASALTGSSIFMASSRTTVSPFLTWLPGATDTRTTVAGIGADNRIGSKFLHAGPGFGGSCFPKDTRALVKTAQDYDVPLRVVEAVMSVNENRKRAMARKVAKAVGGELRGKTIAVLGLTFKPDTDDMREAPSIPLIIALKDSVADVREKVAFALGQLGDPRAIEALTNALKDPQVDVRRQAAFALGQLAR